MALNLFNFNEKKTEVTVFGGTSMNPPLDLAQFVKPTIKNVGVKVDADFKLDSQIKAVVKSSFSQLRQPKLSLFFRGSTLRQ